jgi:RTX calcium-binding nonapeptide repeat (4 copies)
MQEVAQPHRVDAGVTPFGRISFGTASVVCALVLAAAAPAAVAAPGDIYVADRDAGPGGTGAVIRVDPATGAQQVVASGEGLEDPTGIAVDLFAFPGHDTLLVADPEAFGGGGAVFRVDAATGLTQVISSGGRFVDPIGVTGFLLVADANADPPNPQVGDGDLISVDPRSGAQRSVAPGVSLSPDADLVDPSSIAHAPSGSLYVADPEASGGGGAAFLITAPVRTLGSFFFVIAEGGSLVDPAGLVTVPSGVAGQAPIAVVDQSAEGSGAVIGLRGSGQSTTQQVISSGAPFAEPSGIAYTPFAGGPLLVADRAADGGSGALLRVDPLTGAQSVVSSGGSFVEPAGVAVVPPLCDSVAADVVGSEQADQIGASTFSDVIAALGGDDDVTAGESDDLVCGGEGNDELHGDDGDPLLFGPDTLLGENGNDELVGGARGDRLIGGPGGDKLRAKGGGKDRVNCGPGRDRARADRKDRVRGCERVKR